MKPKLHLIILILGIVVASCKFDTYDPPTSYLTGRIVYNDTAINVREPGSSAQVYFQLFETGWQKFGSPISVYVNQEGSFSALLFNGTYKMVFKVAEPFMKVTDTTSLVINGDTKLDIPVTPYWLIRNPQYTVAADSTVTATFKISKIITDANAKTINRVAIFINRTRIVDDGINFATAYKTTISDLNNVTLSAKVSKTYPSGYGVGNQSYFYVRIGLRVTGINNYIFSPVQKIDLPH